MGQEDCSDIQHAIGTALATRGLPIRVDVSWDDFHGQYKMMIDLSNVDYNLGFSGGRTLRDIFTATAGNAYFPHYTDSLRKERLTKVHKTDFDIVTLHEFTNESADIHVQAYDRIAALCKRREKTEFQPRYIFGVGSKSEKAKQFFGTGKQEEEAGKDCVYMMNELLVAQAKLVIDYHGFLSDEVGACDLHAKMHGKWQIHLVGPDCEIETVEEILNKTRAVETFGRKPASAYSASLRAAPYMSAYRPHMEADMRFYPRTWEIIRFQNNDDLVGKLETSMKKFFDEEVWKNK